MPYKPILPPLWTAVIYLCIRREVAPGSNVTGPIIWKKPQLQNILITFKWRRFMIIVLYSDSIKLDETGWRCGAFIAGAHYMIDLAHLDVRRFSLPYVASWLAFFTPILIVYLVHFMTLLSHTSVYNGSSGSWHLCQFFSAIQSRILE